MQLVRQDLEALEREPTILKDTQVGKEFYRRAKWTGGGTTVTVEAIAFVTGIRARNNEDGSRDLLDLTGPTLPLGKNEFIQPIERVKFLWTRQRTAEDGITPITETAEDFCDEVGLVYALTVEEAEKQCRIFMENLEFEKHCDPDAWD